MSFTLRDARPEDLPALVRLIGALAEYERLTHLLEVTPETLGPHLFGERPVAQALVAELGADTGGTDAREVIAFALYFRNFSTFLAKPGLYLEDLFVMPAHRGLGVGKALLRALGAIAHAQGCGRFEWSVLDWNADAIRFYEAMGATVLPDWRICRVSGEALERFAHPHEQGALRRGSR